MDKATRRWLEDSLGHPPRDPALFERALTHASYGPDQYERLEFLGDRVLGLAIAVWLYELFPDEPEGQLSKRLNALVAREACAGVGRALGVGDRMRLGKQARDDGASDSDNVIGDVVEALIGALYLDAGLDGATAFVRRAWGERVSAGDEAPQHPKSALQEWAAAQERKPPAYRLAGRSGPPHAPTFVVEVEIKGVGSASAEGASKQEAETAAAAKLLEQLK
ncbi:MAG TPA: ribonuclease III [Allosphingosinicella sp.]|nr:ribonuclease III [Allosphingosinicella sp.]